MPVIALPLPFRQRLTPSRVALQHGHGGGRQHVHRPPLCVPGRCVPTTWTIFQQDALIISDCGSPGAMALTVMLCSRICWASMRV